MDKTQRTSHYRERHFSTNDPLKQPNTPIRYSPAIRHLTAMGLLVVLLLAGTLSSSVGAETPLDTGSSIRTHFSQVVELDHNLGVVTDQEIRQARIAASAGQTTLDQAPQRIQDIVMTAVIEETLVESVRHSNPTSAYASMDSESHNAGGPGCYTSRVTKQARSYLGFVLRFAETKIRNWCYNSNHEFTSTPWVTRASNGSYGWVACGWSGTGEGLLGSNAYNATGWARFLPASCANGMFDVYHLNDITVNSNGDVSWQTS